MQPAKDGQRRRADQGFDGARPADETKQRLVESPTASGLAKGDLMSSSSRNWRGGAVPSRPTSNVIYFNELDRSNHFAAGRSRTSLRPRSVLPSGRSAKEAS